MTRVSVILPTYNEAENLPVIVPEISRVLAKEGLDHEILVIDDHSPDKTAEVALSLARTYPVRVHVRTEERGLATAVIKGFELAQGEICVVMDADSSHPVERIPDMIRPILEDRCDATVGSRYRPGGSCLNWPWTRRLVSRLARGIARGLTTLSDPTSGFMAIKRSLLEGLDLDPIGWKIVLEVVVKADPRLLEVPIVFSDRRLGRSKLNAKAQKEYLIHLWRLYRYKYKWSKAPRFSRTPGPGAAAKRSRRPPAETTEKR